MLTRLLRSTLHRLGYETRKRDRRFKVAGLTYAPDPCSVGLTPQGELTGRAAARMIAERDLRELRVLDLCCGEGIVGLTLFRESGQRVRALHLADINIFNLNSLHRTLALNGLDGMRREGRIRTWLSDGLQNIPPTPYDIIVSNPPHVFRPDHTSEGLSPGALGTYDADWAFHRAFYAVCHDYLSERGEVWFLENGAAATPETFVGYIRANPRLAYRRDFVEPNDAGFFWMITGRA